MYTIGVSGHVAEVSKILRVRLKTDLYEDLTRQATVEGYASLADWARYLLIRARGVPVGESQASLLGGPSPEWVGSKGAETVPPSVGGQPVILEGEVSATPLTDEGMKEFLDEAFRP